jgi:hydrophobic/amphiphilic exporter-1 (mainly G- bacteria), HAE1 family
MAFIHWCVKYPVSVVVGMILATLFGIISLYRIPLQMTPTVDRPEITVETEYPGAAPLEVEHEVTDRQEERLNSAEGLSKITSTSIEGRSRIVLKFDWGTNKDIARLDVSEKLDLVKELPVEAKAPTIQAVNSDEETPIAWITTITSRPLNEVREEVEDVAQARLERVEGVGAVWLFGGQEREVRVYLDPARLAARALTVTQVRDAVLGENRNTRAGNIDEGRRRYVVRTVGQFDDLDQLRHVIVARQGASATPVYLHEVATVDFGYKEPQGLVRRMGQDTVALGVLRKTGANTVEVMKRVRAELAYLNRLYAGKDLRFEQVYDETVYIDQAVSLVTSNIVSGGLLAALALLIFLRNIWSVGIMAITIPVGVIATFIFVDAFGRSLNIIMLAGLAFAVGTVMDNSIVVLENIFRHRAMGKGPVEAAIEGTREVWGSMLASTITTLAVFVPIIFVKQEAGQLFRDIAIALALVNALSLLVTVSVTPMMAARLLRMQQWGRTPRQVRLVDLLTFGWLGRPVAAGFERLLIWLDRGALRRVVTATGIVAASVVAAWLLMPPIDYLPQGNRNFIFGIVKTPPGVNLGDKTRMIEEIEARVLDMPQLENFFTVVRGEDPFVGAIFKPEHSSVRQMQEGLTEFRGRTHGIPGTTGVFVAQVPLFRRSGGGVVGGVNVEVDVRGDSLEEIQRISSDLQGGLRRLPFVNFINSSFDLGNPELQVRPDRERARTLGLTAADVGYVVETMVAGSLAGLFRDRGKELDLTLIGEAGTRIPTHELANLNIAAPGGRVVRLADVASVEHATGPTKIDHADLDRSITLTANINPQVPLGEAIQRIEAQIVAPARAALPLGYVIGLSGQAQDLAVTFDVLKWSFLLAIVITYLVMCSLYESWSVPLIVMFSVPLAMTGGIVGLKLVNLIEPTVKMDVVTMLGFIILAGVVVNNAILLVDVALQRMNAGADPKSAMLDSATTRLRPIAMTAVAAVIGLLPLVVSSGAGSELYRGLGAVMVGGLAMSTVFTLVLIPILFTLWFDVKERVGQVAARVWNGRRERRARRTTETAGTT